MQRVLENLEKILNFPGCPKNFQEILLRIYKTHTYLHILHDDYYISKKSSIGHISNCRFEAYRNNFRSQEIQCTWSFAVFNNFT